MLIAQSKEYPIGDNKTSDGNRPSDVCFLVFVLSFSREAKQSFSCDTRGLKLYCN